MEYKPEEIGKLIKAERKKHKMSQEQLGEVLRVTGKQISNYEHGNPMPPMDILLKICKFFDCELGYILGEKDYSQGTKLKTIISDETGLNIEAINAIIRLTGTERECINWGYESEKYRRILNTLFTSKGFLNFIETLVELDDSYQKKAREQEILIQLSNELGDPLFNKAMKLRDVTSEDEEAANLTTEECKAIKKVNAALDKCYELHCEFIQETKVHRFSIQEALTLLLNEIYPMPT